MSGSVAREDLGYVSLREISESARADAGVAARLERERAIGLEAAPASDEAAFLQLRDEHYRVLRCIHFGRAIGNKTASRLAVHDLRRFGFLNEWKLTAKGIDEAAKKPSEVKPPVDPATAAAREVLVALLAYRAAARVFGAATFAEAERHLRAALEHLGYRCCASCGGTNRDEVPDGHGESAVTTCRARGCVAGLVRR